MNTYGFHSIHGRATAIATGLKTARPELSVWIVTGDGDGLSIGGNHLIHAARRNLDLTAICANNRIYGMTGGQVTPTTPLGIRTATTPQGNSEPPFDLCRLVAGAGATYVARYSTYHIRPLIRSLKKALTHEGFAFVEVLSPCPSQVSDSPQNGSQQDAMSAARAEGRGENLRTEFVS